VAGKECIQVRNFQRRVLVCGVNQISRTFFKATLVANLFLRRSMANTQRERGKSIATRLVNEQKGSIAVTARICQMMRDLRDSPNQAPNNGLFTRRESCRVFQRSFGALWTQAPAPRHEALFLPLLNVADYTKPVHTPRFEVQTLHLISDLARTSIRQSTGVIETSFQAQSWLETMSESDLSLNFVRTVIQLHTFITKAPWIV
jgi:hypothetical protein